MTIRNRYHIVSKQWYMLFICLFAGISAIYAQDFMVTPASRTICKGEQAYFEVVPDANTPTGGYRWWRQLSTGGWVQVQGVYLPGFYAGSDVDLPGTYYYKCDAVLLNGELGESNVFTLVINTAPVITGFDLPSVCNGKELSVTVDSTDPDFIKDGGYPITGSQWNLNGTPTTTSGTDSNIPPFVIPAASTSDGGSTLTLTLTNRCGSTTSDPPRSITVWATPTNPIPVKRDYCTGETAVPLSIVGLDEEQQVGNPAVWYKTATGDQTYTSLPDEITPKTGQVGTQRWWVSQKVTYPPNPNVVTCESEREEVVVKILARPSRPASSYTVDLCLNDPDITLNATGTDLQWYDSQKKLPSAPQISTSIPGTQTYFVTQHNGECESDKESGKITVQINNRSMVDAIEFNYDPVLCPNNSTILSVTSQRPNPTYAWYANDNKTGFIKYGPTLNTPVLMRDTVFYVTVQFVGSGECESNYPKAAIVNVRDITLPQFIEEETGYVITVLPQLIVSTDNDKCEATVQHPRPAVRDNCTTIVDSLKLFIFDEKVSFPLAPIVYPLGDTTLMWWVQDQAGNRDYALQTISVRDTEKPSGTCPSDIKWDINENEDSAVIDYIVDYSDNCSDVVDTLVRLIYTNNFGVRIDTLHLKGSASGREFRLGTTRVRHIISDQSRNTDTCQFNVEIRHPYRTPDIALRVIPGYEICAGQEVVITPLISGGSGRFNYAWKPRTWNDAVMRDYPMTSTTYEVTVDDGVTDPQTKTVQIAVLNVNPVALTLEGRPMDEIFEGDEVLVTATTGFSSYKLLLNNQEIQISGLNNKVGFQAELGTYFVRVFASDESGCVSQDQIEIEVKSEKLPNLFTPNLISGKNQKFLEFLENPQNPDDFQLTIFSRAGELLYQGNQGWDG